MIDELVTRESSTLGEIFFAYTFYRCLVNILDSKQSNKFLSSAVYWVDKELL